MQGQSDTHVSVMLDANIEVRENKADGGTVMNYLWKVAKYIYLIVSFEELLLLIYTSTLITFQRKEYCTFTPLNLFDCKVTS